MITHNLSICASGFRDRLLLHGGQFRPEDARRHTPVLLTLYYDPVPVSRDCACYYSTRTEL